MTREKSYKIKLAYKINGKHRERVVRNKEKQRTNQPTTKTKDHQAICFPSQTERKERRPKVTSFKTRTHAQAEKTHSIQRKSSLRQAEKPKNQYRSYSTSESVHVERLHKRKQNPSTMTNEDVLMYEAIYQEKQPK